MKFNQLIKELDILYRQNRDRAYLAADSAYHYNRYVNLVHSFSELKLSETISRIRLYVIDTLLSQTYLAPKLREYFLERDRIGAPYTEKQFKEEPRRISQLKKFLNALYHAEQAFVKIEHLHIKEPGQWHKLPWKVHQGIRYAYKAAHLATHLDVKLMVLLKPQLETLRPIFALGLSYMPGGEWLKDVEFPDMAEYVAYTQQNTSAYQVGKVTATVVEQMRPSESYDYAWLAKISAKLPLYIDQLRVKLEDITNTVVGQNSGLSEAELRRLQQEADKLLESVKNIQGHSLFNPLNIPSYITIVKKLLAIYNSIMAELLNLNEGSKGILKEKLFKLKYRIMPQLLILADNIEDMLMLRPGLLSEKMLSVLSRYYDFVVDKMSSVIDFDKDEEAQGLKVLFDESFMAERIEGRHKRIDVAKKELILIDKAKEALAKFNQLLRSNTGSTLSEYPLDLKKELKIHYLAFQQYVVDIDPALDDTIVSALNKLPMAEDHSFLAKVKWPFVVSFNFFSRKTGIFNTAGAVLSIEDKIQSLIRKDANSLEFDIELNQNVIAVVKEQLKAVQKIPQVIDEPVADLSLITPEDFLTERLEETESRDSHQKRLAVFYQNYLTAHAACQRFIDGLQAHIDGQKRISLEQDRQRLLVDYHQFKEYMALMSHQRAFRLDALVQDWLVAEVDAAELPNLLDKSSYPQSMIRLCSQFKDTTVSELCLKVIRRSENKVERSEESQSSYNKLFRPLLIDYVKQQAKMVEEIESGDDKLRVALNGDVKPLTFKDIDKRTLLLANSEAKKELRYLYYFIQPYLCLIDIPEVKEIDALVRALLNTDEKASYEQRKTLIQQLVANDNINTIQEVLKAWACKEKDKFAKVVNAMRKDLSDILSLERGDAALVALTQKEKRAYLLKTSFCSDKVKQVRTCFDKYLHALNDKLTEQLKPADYGVPYPELEVGEERIVVPAQVLAIKRIHNALYYIGETIAQLEAISEKSYKAVYVTRLLLALGYAKNAFYLIEAARRDPFIIELADKTKQALVDVQALIPKLYILNEDTDVEEAVAEKEKAKAKSKSLDKMQLGLELLYVLPQQIHALGQNKALDRNEKARLIRQANEVDRRIKKIIAESSHWTKVLIKLPEMHAIFKEIRASINRLTDATYEETMDNLKNIKDVIFTRILEIADNVEKEFVLKPGTISQDLHLMLADFYQGLLVPLSIPDLDKLNLELDFDYITLRGQHVEQQIAEITENAEIATPMAQNAKKLKELVVFLNSKRAHYFSFQSTVDANRRMLVRLYQEMHPFLVGYDAKLEADFLNDTDAITPEKIARLIAPCDKIYVFATERAKTIGLAKDICQSKAEYINHVLEKVLKDKESRLKEYTETKYEEILQSILLADERLSYIKLEYIEEVSKKLAMYKDSITALARRQANIDSILQQLIKQGLKAFDDLYFEHYQTLDKTMALCEEYQDVLRAAKMDMPHDVDVIARQKTLNEFHHMLQDKTLTPKQRIVKSVYTVNSPAFRDTLARPMSYRFFSLSWLSQWFEKLYRLLLGRKSQEEERVTQMKTHVVTMVSGQGFFAHTHVHDEVLQAYTAAREVVDIMPAKQPLLVY